MKTYSLLAFDFDGTLVDTVGDIAHHANAVLQARGISRAPVEKVKSAIGFGVHELFKGISPHFHADAASLESAVEDFKKRYRREPVIFTRPFAHVLETLRGPLKNTPKAIVTNKPQDITLQILDTLGMTRDFEIVIGMHAGYPPKPDPASLRAAMEKMGAEPSRTIYIGDSNVDAQTCRNAGVDFAWVDYGYDILPGDGAVCRFSKASEWEELVEDLS